tara:strand:+ start:660 stop:899 length:240 start_codon:yes stop_codon:yes gene_type:complete
MKFIGKLEFLPHKALKRYVGRKKVEYYRVTVVGENGKVECLALTPLELKKARKRAAKGILYQRPTFFMRLYAALVVLLS